MQISKYNKCMIGILLIFILIKGILFYHENNFSLNIDYKPNTDPSYVRIYYDIATIPTLYELEDFLNQSKDSVVFLAWDRIPHLEEKLKNRKNVYFLKHTGENTDSNVDYTEFQKYYREHPNSKYIVHCNEFWLKNIFPLLSVVPEENIEEINLYEDGSYASIIEPRKIYYIKTDIALQSFRNTKKVYHIAGFDILNSKKCIFDKKCIYTKKRMKNDTIVRSSISDLEEILRNNPDKKEEYFRILGFDYKKYEKQMIHPFGIYTFTAFRKNLNLTSQDHIAFMEELLYGKLNYLIKDKNTKWFYKEHPEKYQIFAVSDYMKEKHPEVGRIEKHIPLEMFLVAGIVPDYIAGYSSGIYLNVPKETIAAYIKRPDDTYMYIIKKDKKIRPGRIFELKDYDNSLKSRIKRFISKIQTGTLSQ